MSPHVGSEHLGRVTLEDSLHLSEACLLGGCGNNPEHRRLPD